MSKINNYGKNMRLYTSAWMDQATGSGYKTLKMMPINEDCPYTEVIMDRSAEGTALVIISKLKKQNLQKVPRLTDMGDPEPAKRPRPSGKDYKEQRVTVEMFQEYYIMDKEEQISFIKEFAVNAEEYDFEVYLDAVSESAIMQNTEEGKILDSKGTVIIT
jgi:hypothetical protein